jgi:hypothetical protein
MFVAHSDLLREHDGVQKSKERLQNCYFWLHMDNAILKTHLGMP